MVDLFASRGVSVPCGPSSVSPPSNAAEALAMAEAALDFFNSADLPSLPVAVQAECLQAWSRLEAKRAAAEAGLIAAFWASDGPAADGQQSVTAWLTKFTRCTKTAARRQVAAAFWVRDHRHIERALADGQISTSYGKWISDAVAMFDEGDQEAIAEILVTAAVGGTLIEDLEQVATAALRRLRPGGQERAEARAHADRGLTVSKTFGGVGRLNGDLDAETTALAETVIGALAVKAGPEDERTPRQRRHDALAEALRRLVGANLLPERGGAKPHVKIDMSLATLRRLPGSRKLESAWVDKQLAELARRRIDGATVAELLADPALGVRPPAPAGPNALANQAADDSRLPTSRNDTAQTSLFEPDDGAVLDGVGPISDGLAGALTCDAVVTPTVVGAVNPDALDQMTAAWLSAHTPGRPPAGVAGADTFDGSAVVRGTSMAVTPDRPPASGEARERGQMTRRGCLRLRESMLRWAIEVLSGPTGLASHLRAGLLDRPLSTPSIVLDVGADDRTVPAPLERAVRRRDRHCRFPACDQPAELSQVHHLIPRSEGGSTALWNLLSLCSFHHLIAVHTWGWQLRLRPDGRVTATGPDRRVLHENDPPLHAA